MAGHDVVVIGGSAGAVEAIAEIARGFPPDFPAAVLIVIHFPPSGSSALPAILNRAGTLPARHAVDGETIHCGRIYIAPPDRHLLVDHGRIRTVRGPRENGHRPAIDPLFRTAARAYGPRVVGVILSGNLDDGTMGMRRVVGRGGVAVVQHPEDAHYKGMPSSAIAHTTVHHVVPLAEIAPLLSELVRTPVEVPMRPTDDPGGTDAVAHDPILDPRPPENGAPSAQTCPECHGTLWEVHDGDLAYYRCRVGHAYSSDTLLAHQAEELDAALWTALRALEEHAALARRLAARADKQQLSRVSSSYAEQALDSEHHAAVIRRVINRLQLPATEGAGPNEPGMSEAVSA
jgi:two-component system chemotaxis response regulator CheB